VAVASQGLQTLDRLGAVAAASLVRRRLRERGVRHLSRGPRATTRANPGRLTDRQLEILTLLAAGRTNAEIADRLHLSRRTVDNHVAALLTRLDVGSRHDAVTAAVDLGLLRPRERET
jgi:DNA-binding NarL/FixJ family response regulator